MFAHRLSRFLSRLALVSSAFAIFIVYLASPSLGYEGTIFISAVAVALAIGAGLLSLLLGGLLLLRRQPPRPVNAITVASLAIALALAQVWLL